MPRKPQVTEYKVFHVYKHNHDDPIERAEAERALYFRIGREYAQKLASKQREQEQSSARAQAEKRMLEATAEAERAAETARIAAELAKQRANEFIAINGTS